MKEFHCTISSPEEIVFDGELTTLTVPTGEGTIQILADHMPLVSTLGTGEISYIHEKEEKLLQITHGVVEVKDDKVVVLVVVKEE